MIRLFLLQGSQECPRLLYGRQLLELQAYHSALQTPSEPFLPSSAPEESISCKKSANHVRIGIGKHLPPSLVQCEFEYEDCCLAKSIVTVVAGINQVKVNILREMKGGSKCSEIFRRAQQAMMHEQIPLSVVKMDRGMQGNCISDENIFNHNSNRISHIANLQIYKLCYIILDELFLKLMSFKVKAISYSYIKIFKKNACFRVQFILLIIGVLIMSVHAFQVESSRSRFTDHELKRPLIASHALKEPNPVDISFTNISYAVEVELNPQRASLPWRKQKTTKIIIDNVTGIVRAGQVAAILGASGAGKTSLLNIIACRVDKTQGKLLANKTQYDYGMFGDFANYVMQSDVLMTTLTVRETLIFAADLRLNISKSEKEARVYELAKSMKLLGCMDVLVGGPTLKGISGGEKKRTSIAFELISDPQVIMLDQPTSGLDSLTSYVIVDYLSHLAKNQGKTVLMTIHQPNNEIFNKFDRLFVMVQGRLAYQGSAHKVIDYFSQHFKLECSQYQNPAQFVIEKVHHENKSNVDRYPTYFQKYSIEIAPHIEHQIMDIRDMEVVKRIMSVSLSVSFGALLKRTIKNLWRNPMMIKSRLIQSTIMGVYIGGLYFGIGHTAYTNFTDAYALIGFLFFISIASMMVTLTPVALVFPTERAVFLKEESSRLYGTTSYFISKNLVEVPYLILMPLLTITIFYWMIGLANTADQFFSFYFINLLVSLCGNSLGMLLGSVVNDEKSVSVIEPIVVVPFILFSGYFKNGANLADWVGWIQYISPIKYGFEANTINQVGEDSLVVTLLNFDIGFWPCAGYLTALAVGFSSLSLVALWLLRNKLE